MERNPNNQLPLLLCDIWDNVFLKLCNVIVGNDSKCDYFVVGEENEKFRIIRVSNKESRWECMLEPGIAWYFKGKIKDGFGKNSSEFKSYVSDIFEGNIKEKEKGNSFKRTNLRYEELLRYLVEKGNGTITDEIEFVKNTVVNSCMLKLYLEEKTRGGNVVDETQVLKSDLVLFRDRVRLDYIEEAIRQYLSKYYKDIETENALTTLAIVILRTLCEVTVSGKGGGLPLKNEQSINELQTKFLCSIEDYLKNDTSGKPPEINVSLIAGWEKKWFSLRKNLVEEFHFAESTNLIKALDNTHKLRERDIKIAALGLGLKDRLEINAVWIALKEEMEQLDVLLEGLRRLKDAMSGLRERNTYEAQNETEEIVEEAISLHLRLENK